MYKISPISGIIILMEFSFRETSDISDKEIQKSVETVYPYIESISEKISQGEYNFPECSTILPSDKSVYEKCSELIAIKKTENLKYVFVIGIGGSSLGTKALYDAEFLFTDDFDISKPEVFFIDTINPRLAHTIEKFRKKNIEEKDNFLIVLATKSGETTETIANYQMLKDVLKENFSERDFFDRTIVITNEKSPLKEFAEEKKLDFLTIPDCIGGRFSVFSEIGILPLCATGIDIPNMLESATHMRTNALSLNEKNIALRSAAITYIHMTKRNKNIYNTFIFGSRLHSIGAWQGQLFAESLGKSEEVGITPTTATGTTDLHSLAQLYLGGPKDKLTSFLWVEDDEDGEVISGGLGLVDGLSGKTPKELKYAIYEGTKRAFTKANRPYVEYSLKNNAEIGGYMQSRMMEVMYLAHLYGINAFNQPAVEIYKTETRKLLDTN